MKKYVLACLLTAISVIFVLALAGMPVGTGRKPPRCRFSGQCEFLDPVSKNTVEARFEYTVDPVSFAPDFAIFPTEKGAFEAYHLRPEIGQQFLVSAYVVPFGSYGKFLVTDWEYGATAKKMMIFRLAQRRVIEPIFEGVARFGFNVVNVTGGDLPDVVGGYGDLPAAEKQMKVYSFRQSRFVLVKSVQVEVPHHYVIREKEELGKGDH